MNESEKGALAELSPIDDNFRVAMKMRRESLGLSLQSLSDKLSRMGFDFKRQVVHNIEAGRRRVRLPEAVAIAGALDISLDDMLSDQRDLNAARHALELHRVAISRLHEAAQDIEQASADAQMLLKTGSGIGGLQRGKLRFIARQDLRRTLTGMLESLDSDAAP